jgi:hypothetical protein
MEIEIDEDHAATCRTARLGRENATCKVFSGGGIAMEGINACPVEN